MSFFSWFVQKPMPVSNPALEVNGKRRSGQPSPLAPAADKPAGKPQTSTGTAGSAAGAGGGQNQPLGVERKVKRHARREQLYVAIRESMTRAGMLSASYKFKVLSLDQNGNQFLVMMDIASNLSTSTQKLTQTEEILTQTAKAGYGIVVTAVYWRVDPRTLPKQAVIPAAVASVSTTAATIPVASARPAAITPLAVPAITELDMELPLAAHADAQADAFAETQANPPYTPEMPQAQQAQKMPEQPLTPPASTQPAPPATQTKPQRDALLEAEVAAFKRALAYKPPAAVKASVAKPVVAPEVAVKGQTVNKSYTLITGFEDTEMPDSPAMPALSATQYGELN